MPIGFATPPNAVVVDEGERRFITGPFDSGPTMLVSPSCAIAAQGIELPAGAYAHPARIIVPLRPLEELLESGAIPQTNLPNLRQDRLRNYLYLPKSPFLVESVGLLYMPVTMHHDVIAKQRIAQLTGTAHWHLRAKLMVFAGGFLVDPSNFGSAPSPQERTS